MSKKTGQHRLRRQELRDIRIADLTPNRSFPADRLKELDDLRAAVESSGFIVPPLVMVMATKDRRYEVIEGHRRIAVARELGYESLGCFVILDTDGLDPGDLFLKIHAERSSSDVRRSDQKQQAAILEWQFKQGPE